ncbi:MAG: 30S ribosomal protein S3 [Spirochaetes bacterium]|nr:30S ribosomal protein S3 [Spirochaetota bacterium]
MGQKVNPIGLRIGIIRTWDSVWFAEKDEYRKNLHEDIQIRKHIMSKFKAAGIAKVGIERFPDRINVYIHTARPGLLIGRKGVDIENLKEELQKKVQKNVNIYVQEVKKPERVAKLVAEQIAAQIENRFPYRRAIKQAITAAMRSGALGIKVNISGRLNGAEMARDESYKEGRIPLHTLRADIDYGFAEALTTFGLIGIKVWIYNGDVLSNVEEQEEEKFALRKKSR